MKTIFISQRILLIDGLSLFSICFVCLLGDCLCYGRPWSFHILSNRYLRALTDNAVHALTSALATGFLFGWSRPFLPFLALIIGSAIDFDHFTHIRTLSLHRVLTVPSQGRPFLHNSFHLLLLTLILIIVEYFVSRSFSYSAIFFISWSTHHLRDGQRHGLNLSPWGKTIPIDYYIPIMLNILLVVRFVQIFFGLTKPILRVNNSIV